MHKVDEHPIQTRFQKSTITTFLGTRYFTHPLATEGNKAGNNLLRLQFTGWPRRKHGHAQIAIGFQSADGCTEIRRQVVFRLEQFDITFPYVLQRVSVPSTTILSLTRIVLLNRSLWSSFLHRHPLITTMHIALSTSHDLRMFLSALMPQDPEDEDSTASVTGELEEMALPNLHKICISPAIIDMDELSLDSAHAVMELLESSFCTERGWAFSWR